MKWLQIALCCIHGFGVTLLPGRQPTTEEERRFCGKETHDPRPADPLLHSYPLIPFNFSLTHARLTHMLRTVVWMVGVPFTVTCSGWQADLFQCPSNFL